MKLTFLAVGLSTFLFASGCAPAHHDASRSGQHGEEESGEDEGEVAVALDQIPAAVLAAAKARVPGLVVEEAVTETEDGRFIYSLAGHDAKGPVEVNVTPDGRVVDVERESGKKGEESEEEEDD